MIIATQTEFNMKQKWEYEYRIAHPLPANEKFSMLIMENPINHPRSKLIVHDLMPMPKKPTLRKKEELVWEI